MKLIRSMLLLLVVARLGTTGFLYAQPALRNLLSQFSEEQIASALLPASQWHPFPRSVKEWEQVLPDSVRQKIITRAEHDATVPFEPLPVALMLQFIHNGNRSNYEAVSFGKRERLFSLALAESMEQKNRFTSAIMEGVWSICEESFWGVPAHLGLQKAGTGLADVEDPVVDLFAGETAAALALTDYLAGNELDTISPLLRKRIYYEVNRRLFVPLEKESGRYWYFGDHTNNWNPWITSNWMISLLLLEKNERRRVTELKHAMTLTDGWLNKLGEDGAIDEGPAYWFDAVGRLFDGISIIGSATAGRISVFDQPYVRLLASYIYKTHIAGNNFIPVADAYPVLQPDGLMLYRFGKAVGDTALQNFGAFFHYKNKGAWNEESTMADQLWNFSVLGECEKIPGREPLLTDVWLKSIQLMVARTNNGLFLATHAGHNGESHNHNDVGDLIVYADGQPVIIDVGSGTYMAKTFSSERYSLWYNSSGYHNLPVINGFQQQAGRQFEATEVMYHSSRTRSGLQMNIAAAYPAEAGIEKWLRDVSADRQSNRIVLNDRYTASAPLKMLTQTFMTTCPVNIEQPGKIFFELTGKKLLLEYDAARWEVKKEAVLHHTPDEKKLEENWAHRPVWRLLLTCKRPAASGNFRYTFTLGK